MQPLHRLRHHPDAAQLPMFPRKRQLAIAPRPQDQVVRLAEACAALFHWHFKGVEFGPLKGAPDAKVDSPARKVVEHCELFGHAYGIVEPD
jgi:hypothetical protein